MSKLSKRFKQLACCFSVALAASSCDSNQESADPRQGSSGSSADQSIAGEGGNTPLARSTRKGADARGAKTWERIERSPEEPIVLEDLSQIKIKDGVEAPPLGVTIYPMSKIPKVNCGQFWIFFGDGYVQQVYACNHADGTPHQ